MRGDEQRRRRAAVLLVLAWVLTLHPWVPALLLSAFVSWALLHWRLEGDFGHRLARGWRRAWPPGSAVLILLLAASTFVFWDSDVRTTAKVLPITLGLIGLSILFGAWPTLCRPPVGALRRVAG
jgi:hypothetical protein